MLTLFFGQYHFNRQEFPERCTGTVEFLTDIELLAHCDYAALTFNSGLAHLVDVLRVALYGKHRSTFVDASNERCARCEGHAGVTSYLHPEVPFHIFAAGINRSQYVIERVLSTCFPQATC